MTELRSWVLERKERLVWPSGGDEEAWAVPSDWVSEWQEDEEKEDDEEEEEEEEEDEEEKEVGNAAQRARCKSELVHRRTRMRKACWA